MESKFEFIEYINGVKPHEARDLSYEELRQEILNNLIAPSHQLMTIYVALKGDKK